MRFLVAVFVGICVYGLCSADSSDPQPVAGDWNVTNPGLEGKLCIRMQAAIRMDINYATNNGSTKTATILSQKDVVVDEVNSQCDNSSRDTNETLALNFGQNRTLEFHFTRDPQITTDKSGNRWQLYKIEFAFVYDAATFPDSADLDKNATLTNTNTTLSGIATSCDRSFSCSKTGTIDVTDRFKISFSNLRTQPFITKDDFSTPDHCQADQETTDLIPIIIGAALATLVIVVLIAYLIGRARANRPAYDNMK
jgi:lysosomal-associated membrane protein 1/2